MRGAVSRLSLRERNFRGAKDDYLDPADFDSMLRRINVVMRHARSKLLFLFLAFTLVGGVLAVRGQDREPLKDEVDEPKKDPKKDPEPKPRPKDEAEADRELLKKHAVDASPKSLLEFFRQRTLKDEERPAMQSMVQQLGSGEFRKREKAMDELLKRGPAVLEFLRVGAKSPDLELSRRATACIERIRANEPPADVAAAVARTAMRGPPTDLAASLIGFIPYADSDYVSDEVRKAMKSLAKTDPGPLIAALVDSHPVRRAAAGEALAGLKEHAAAARKLLTDPEPFVRLRVAESFVIAGDKAAVPVLIDNLPQVTASQAWTAEDLLMRMADGKSPPMLPRVGKADAGQKYRDAWTAWWQKNEKTVDLAKLHEVPELLGHTVVVLLDLGRVMELNAKNDPVWQIDGLVFPLDVQFLANGNVLVAEYHANRVTERDRFKGEVKWQKEITGPLMAQRLPNRNTFMATDTMVLEVDEKGEEVYSFTMPVGERMMKVTKAPNGEIVAITSDSRVVRFDEKGKELGSFQINANARLFGGRIHVLANGRVLVPHHQENKVVEYDGTGQVVWEATVPQPVAAVRLPNGNTLVTTMQPQTGAMEFDRQGRETDWNFRHQTRVTRAIRR